MATGKAHINGAVLEWARKEASMSLSDAAEAAKIKEARGIPGEERIRGWETGVELPTKNQLQALASAYVKPLITFYLSQPPTQGRALPDFRRLSPDQAVMPPRLRALVAKMEARQEEIVELLTEDEEEAPSPLEFIGKYTAQSAIRDVVADLRFTLGVSEAAQRAVRDNGALLRLLRNAAEQLGIYVIIQGDLGNYHSKIEPEDFRGFCLSHAVAPFVVLNSYDAKPAQTFTLMHELCHLWLGASGISNVGPVNDDQGLDEIESFCNKVASEFLLPLQSLLAEWMPRRNDDPYEAINEIAREFSVSRRAVAYRLRMEEELSFPVWRSVDERFNSEYAKWKEAQKQKQQLSKSGPSHYVIKRFNLGRRLIGTVLNALDTGTIGYTSASRILGVPSKGFSKIRLDV